VRARAAFFALTVTTTSLSALVMIACDLDLKPYVDPVEGGIPFSPTDTGSGTSSGNTPTSDVDVPVQDAGPDALLDGGADGGGRKRVFVTSTVTSGNMNGVAGATNLCNQRATTARLNGTFTAWISIENNLAINRIPANTPAYYLVDQQTLVFANRQAIALGPAVVIDRDESNAKVQNPQGVWTGTQSNTTANNNNCNNFGLALGNGLAGNASERDEQWTQDQQTACQTQLHLYCFEL